MRNPQPAAGRRAVDEARRSSCASPQQACDRPIRADGDKSAGLSAARRLSGPQVGLTGGQASDETERRATRKSPTHLCARLGTSAFSRHLIRVYAQHSQRRRALRAAQRALPTRAKRHFCCWLSDFLVTRHRRSWLLALRSSSVAAELNSLVNQAASLGRRQRPDERPSSPDPRTARGGVARADQSPPTSATSAKSAIRGQRGEKWPLAARCVSEWLRELISALGVDRTAKAAQLAANSHN